MYVCGMTVYDLCHLGHARVFVVFDMVTRWLRASGYRVEYVRNITDIDDKIIKRAQENGETPAALTERFIAAMHEDERALGVLPPDHEPRATEYVAQMLAMIGQLIRNGLAYPAPNGDVYYSVRAFPELRPPVRQEPRRAARRRARGRRPQQARSDGFRAVESRQTGRAGVGLALGTGPPRLAYRMLGDERRPARQTFRHPRRRPGSAVSAPRKRDRAVRRRARLHLRQLLDAQRLRAGGQRKDVQVAGQLLHHPRGAGKIRCRSGALLHPARALPQPAELFGCPPGRCQGRADAAVHGAEECTA